MMIRFTARSSLVLFCLAFGAAALARLWPNAWTRWLRRNRRALGVSFAASHGLHAAAIVGFAAMDQAGFAAATSPASYVFGGLGYALLGTSRQLAVGPTSAISLMIAGTVGDMAGGDAAHYAAIASLAGFTVALLCLISWLMRLSILVRLISDSILVGFKAGAGLTIIMTLWSLMKKAIKSLRFVLITVRKA